MSKFFVFLAVLMSSIFASASSDPDWDRARWTAESNVWARYPLQQMKCGFSEHGMRVLAGNTEIFQIKTGNNFALYARCMAGLMQAKYSEQGADKQSVFININTGESIPESGFYSQRKPDHEKNLWGRFPAEHVRCQNSKYLAVLVDGHPVFGALSDTNKFLKCQAAMQQIQLDKDAVNQAVFVNLSDGAVLPESGFYFLKNAPTFVN